MCILYSIIQLQQGNNGQVIGENVLLKTIVTGFKFFHISTKLSTTVSRFRLKTGGDPHLLFYRG